MKSIKNIILSSVALFTLSNNALAQEILVDTQQLEQEVKQELQLTLQSLALDLNTQLVTFEVADTQNLLLTKNTAEAHKKTSEELAD